MYIYDICVCIHPWKLGSFWSFVIRSTSAKTAAQHFGVQWNLTNIHMCSTKRDLVCDGFKWILAASCIPLFRRLPRRQVRFRWRITSGTLIPQKPYSAWWFQKYVRLFILDFRIYEAGKWKKWTTMKNWWTLIARYWMDTKSQSEIANVAILGRMAPSDFSLEAVTGESAAPVKSLEILWLRHFGGQTAWISMGCYWDIIGIFILIFGINGKHDFWGPINH